MASQANTEALYEMFSRLLDRKISELQKMGTTTSQPVQTNAVLGGTREDDIKDNYMEELKPESVARQSQIGRNSLNNFRLQHLTNGVFVFSLFIFFQINCFSVQWRRRSSCLLRDHKNLDDECPNPPVN